MNTLAKAQTKVDENYALQKRKALQLEEQLQTGPFNA